MFNKDYLTTRWIMKGSTKNRIKNFKNKSMYDRYIIKRIKPEILNLNGAIDVASYLESLVSAGKISYTDPNAAMYFSKSEVFFMYELVIGNEPEKLFRTRKEAYCALIDYLNYLCFLSSIGKVKY